MKKIKFASLIGMSLIMGAVFVMASCGASGGAKKPKGIVLQEGDRAVVSDDKDFTTIEFPAELTSEDMELYSTDLLGYLLKSNAPMSNSGTSYGSYNIYYYLHNSKEWLYKGSFEHPYEMIVSKIKSVKIADYKMRLREFYEQMPYMNDSKEKKSDSNYQNEIRFGENYYLFFEIDLRD